MDLFIYRTRRFYRLYFFFAALYFIWFLVGLVVVAGGLTTPFGSWADFIFIGLATITLFFHAIGHAPLMQTAYLFSGVVLFTTLVEWVGTVTGFPFGSYTYTDAFGPLLFGSVPIAVPLAWWVIIWPLHLVIHSALSGRGDILYAPVWTALAAVWADGIIEPVATLSRGYWSWDAGGWYYGVPWTNFVGWFFTALILSFFLQVIMPHAPYKKQALRIPVLVLFTTLFTFWVASIFLGQWLAVAVGAGFFIMLRRIASKGRTEGLMQ